MKKTAHLFILWQENELEEEETGEKSCLPKESASSVEHIYGAHFCASATINGKWPALRLSAECRKATWYPSFGGRAVMPAKVGAEGRDFVE